MSEQEIGAVESLKLLTTSLVGVTNAVKELLNASKMMRDRIVALEEDVRKLKLMGMSHKF
jgi:hypothetical protein